MYLIQGAGRDGHERPISIDTSTYALKVIDYNHAEIHSGSHFFYQDSVTLGATGVQTYLITTPDTTTYSHFTYQADGLAITSFTLSEGADRVGVTAAVTFNNDRNSTVSATLQIHKGTSGGTTDGTILKTYSSGASSAQSKSPSPNRNDDELKLKQNTKYVFTITSGTASNLCNVKFLWYEHKDRV